VVCSDEEKVLLDPSRDGSQPFLGLAFKLEVWVYGWFIVVKVLVYVLGWQVWSVDIHEGISRSH